MKALSILSAAVATVLLAWSIAAAQVETTTRDPGPQLREWARSGETAAIRALLAENPGVDVDLRDEEGWTALMLAARDGSDGVVVLLLDAGADVDLVNNVKETPLHIAAKAGRTEVVRLLLQSGARLSPRDAEGRTPLFRAIENRRAETIEVLQGAAQAAFDRVHSAQLNVPPDITEPARIISPDPAPPYTRTARRNGIEGTVVLMVLIRTDGTIGGISVSKGLEESLDQSALRAVSKWSFAPARRGDNPVNAVLEIRIDFDLP